jgi:hypothetical protein
VESICFEGQMHGALMLGAALRDAARMLDLTASRLKSALAKSKA